MAKRMISAIICTYNRCESLKDTLRALAELDLNGAYEAEFIVVDNNSPDQTRAVVEAAAPQFASRLRYVHEPKQGLCAARNKGMQESHGDVIVFTDDDCLPDKNWLNEINRGYDRYDPDCLFGKILPDWQGQTVPQWLLKNERFWANLAMLDHGNDVIQVTGRDQHFFGANFSFKREIYTKGFRFDERYGPVGNSLMRGDDTDLFYKLLADKSKIVYDPASVIWHKVEKDRITKKYFRRWNLNYGLTAAILEKNDNSTRHLNIPRWHIRQAVVLPFKWLGALLLFRPLEAVVHEFKMFYTAGYISGCLKERGKHD